MTVILHQGMDVVLLVSWNMDFFGTVHQAQFIQFAAMDLKRQMKTVMTTILFQMMDAQTFAYRKQIPIAILL